MHRLLNLQNQSQDNNPINMPNKATVKKEFSNRFIRLNQMAGKQNEHGQTNLLQNFPYQRLNLNKNTVRKHSDLNEQSQVQSCANHPDRKSQYLVKIETQILKYCRKCATHIASQGFDVHKIVSTQRQGDRNIKSPNNLINYGTGENLLSNISPNRGRQSNSTKQRIEKEKRMQLSALVNSLKSLREDYKTKQESLTEISQTFQSEKRILNSYYDELIGYIEQIRQIHLQAIDQSAINTVQVCEIQKGEIDETLGEIEEMVVDIEGNFENILTQVDERSYVECFEFYKQKECIFSHRLEELGTEAKPWPCSRQEDMIQKIETFKNFVNELHQVGEGQNNRQQEGGQIEYF